MLSKLRVLLRPKIRFGVLMLFRAGIAGSVICNSQSSLQLLWGVAPLDNAVS